MNKQKTYDSLAEFQKGRTGDPKAAFKVRVAGEMTEALWSKTPCVYFESAVLLYQDGRAVGHTSTHRSRAEIDIIADGARVRVDRGMRLYIEPTWLAKDPPDPEAKACLREAAERTEHKDDALAEFALLPDRDYWARIVREEHWLPPDRPDGPPHRASSTTLYLSDKPFIAGQPQGEAAPMSNWTY